MFSTREEILAVLKEVDSDLRERNEQLTLSIVGYSAIVMANQNNRGSNDIDVMYSRFSTVLRQHGLEVFDEGYFHFHPQYKSRLTLIEAGFTHLTAYYTDPHDIFLLKLNAFREKDKIDLQYMIENEVVQLPLLDQLFREWNHHWFHDNLEIMNHYSQVRGLYGSN
jgi:hypothetical protein